MENLEEYTKLQNIISEMAPLATSLSPELLDKHAKALGLLSELYKPNYEKGSPFDLAQKAVENFRMYADPNLTKKAGFFKSGINCLKGLSALLETESDLD